MHAATYFFTRISALHGHSRVWNRVRGVLRRSLKPTKKDVVDRCHRSHIQERQHIGATTLAPSEVTLLLALRKCVRHFPLPGEGYYQVHQTLIDIGG